MNAPPEPDLDGEPPARGDHPWFGKPIRLQKETVLFLLLSLADMLLTARLLREGRAVESNPVAQMALAAGGIRGMVWFKASLVALVVVITQVLVAKDRERTAYLLLIFAAAVLTAVVIFSVLLLVR